MWWAHQDSNLGPMDSLDPDVSIRSGLSHHPAPKRCGCGTLLPVIKGTRLSNFSNNNPQVVSAPSGGVPPAWLRIAVLPFDHDGFPEFIPFISRLSIVSAPF